MSRTLTITYDKSNEDTPIMCVAENNILSMTVIKIFTGEKAEQLYKELTDQNVVVRMKREEQEMTKEQKDKIIKALAEDRNNYAKDCSRRIAEENGKITGADYMLQRFLDILRTEVDPQESEEEK